MEDVSMTILPYQWNAIERLLVSNRIAQRPQCAESIDGGVFQEMRARQFPDCHSEGAGLRKGLELSRFPRVCPKCAHSQPFEVGGNTHDVLPDLLLLGRVEAK